MTVFVLGCLAFFCLSLFILWLPFLRQRQKPVIHNLRQKTNANIYQRQIETVSKQFDNQEPGFKLLKNELALGLLTEEVYCDNAKPEPKVTFILPLIMSLAVVCLTMTVYHFIGGYHMVSAYVDETQQDPLAGLSDKEIRDVQVVKLQDKIRANPNDSQSWFILAEYYLYSNEFNNALVALDKVTAIEGETNNNLAARAIVLYYKNGQRIDEQTQLILDRILQTEPLQVTALMLIASDRYYHAQYEEAIDIWQRLLDSGNPEIDRIMIIERINVARMMANRE
jgi:formate-dependent nitrite reductase complex subunit NrfG